MNTDGAIEDNFEDDYEPVLAHREGKNLAQSMKSSHTFDKLS